MPVISCRPKFELSALKIREIWFGVELGGIYSLDKKVWIGWLVMYVVGWTVWFSTWALSWVRVGVRDGLHQGFGVWTSKKFS